MTWTPPVLTNDASKPAAYAALQTSLTELLHGEPDLLANAANTSALLFHLLPDLNWAGFYFLQESTLVLGPFQGKPACTRIPLDRGVCGAAASQRQTLIVPDVQAFAGHIACDADSRSEIVVPLLQNDRLLGVLDLDSPVPGRFDADDARGLKAVVQIFLNASTPRE